MYNPLINKAIFLCLIMGFQTVYADGMQFGKPVAVTTSQSSKVASSQTATVAPLIILPEHVSDNPQCESGGQACAGKVQQAVDEAVKAKKLQAKDPK